MGFKLPTDYTELKIFERRLVREQYIKEQNGKCYYCGGDLDKEPDDKKRPINLKLFPPNFFKYNIHLQHCHETNMTEGAVHSYCNAVLWQYYGR